MWDPWPDFKIGIQTFAVVMLPALAIMGYQTWWTAWKNPSLSVTVHINRSGEARLEFFLYPVFLGACFLGLVFLLHDLWRLKQHIRRLSYERQ